MIDAGITRDVSDNYLEVYAENTAETGFEVKMFEGKHIPGFLDMTLRHVDEKNVYQYRIGTYESMADKCNKESMKKRDVKNLIAAIVKICAVSAQYLLDSDKILLKPQYIYYDNDKISFCYFPDNELTISEGIKELMEYVLEHIDHDDRETVMATYGLYQKILKNSYTMESLLKTFDTQHEKTVNGEAKIMSDIGKNNWLNEEYLKAHRNTEMVCEPEEYKDNIHTGKVSKYGTDNENKYNLGYADLTGGIHDTKNTKGIIGKIKELLTKLKNSDEYKDDDSFYSADMENLTNSSIENDYAGNMTMVLEAKKFISISGDNDILLTHFPFVIGSNEKKCDGVIISPMVSRKHAVIWNENNSYYIEDVGSTNGTKLNSERITSCEKVLLTDGDVVDFAGVKYRFG